MKGYLELLDVSRFKVFEATGNKLNPWPLCSEEIDAFSDCRPFVFHIPKDLQGFEVDKSKKEIDAPFPVFSIEHLDGDASVISTPNGLKFHLRCILVMELMPKQYRFFATIDALDGLAVVRLGNYILPVIREYLEKLNVGETGVEKVNLKSKIGTGKLKRIAEISKIIHVRPKRKSVQKEPTSKIDWTHRIEVRGHWRKHNGLGKDRNGVYRINGWTWVKHHTRGPDDLPLIKKPRLFKTTAKEESQDVFS